MIKMIKQLKPDIIVLNETGADDSSAFRKILLGERCTQIFPVRDSVAQTKAGETVIIRPGLDSLLVGRTNTTSPDRKKSNI